MKPIKNKKLRRLLGVLLPGLIVLAVLCSSIPVREDGGTGGSYALWALVLALLALLLFMTGIEQKKTGTRRLVITAIMVALSAVGRLIPFVKPVTALTILAGMYLGREAGFLTGALSALVSDIWFGQGPWTPFQMLAWGLVGYVGGCLSKPLQRHRWLLLLSGALSGALFSLVMDVWTVLWYSGGFSLGMYLTAAVTALPHTLLYAASNVAFLWLLSKPLGDKLRRLQIKYGI